MSGRLAAEAPCPVVTVPPAAAIADVGPVVVGDDGSAHARRALLHAAALAARLQRELIRLEVDEGDVVEVIGSKANDLRACLIATGTRGRGSLRAELFGSVSTGLVQAAGRPVMLVPASAGEPPESGDGNARDRPVHDRYSRAQVLAAGVDAADVVGLRRLRTAGRQGSGRRRSNPGTALHGRRADTARTYLPIPHCRADTTSGSFPQTLAPHRNRVTEPPSRADKPRVVAARVAREAVPCRYGT